MCSSDLHHTINYYKHQILKKQWHFATFIISLFSGLCHLIVHAHAAFHVRAHLAIRNRHMGRMYGITFQGSCICKAGIQHQIRIGRRKPFCMYLNESRPGICPASPSRPALIPALISVFSSSVKESFNCHKITCFTIFLLISAHAFCACRVCVKCAQTQISRLKNFIFQSFSFVSLFKQFHFHRIIPVFSFSVHNLIKDFVYFSSPVSY